MRLLVYLPLLIPALAAVAARPLAARLEPREATWLLTAATVALAGCSTVDYTVERWADEHAAAVTGDRRLVALTIGRVAMLATPGRRPAASLDIVRERSRRISLAWAGPVPRRVAALLGPPPRTRALLMAAMVLIVVLTGASALQAARDLHALLELARAAH